MAFDRKTDRQSRHCGIGQLTLAEHALCPLQAASSDSGGLIHECDYRYFDGRRQRVRSAHARVTCPAGLLPNDEFYLWGLLALTLDQPEPDCEFHATPHYCLRQLGLIDQRQRRGGRQYRQFAEAIERLSQVSYQCDAFYDPIRREHRRVGFHFLSYSLPLDDQSGRAWRFVWDPIFLELVRPVGGHLPFDLPTYRQLDPATRRLFLLLTKIFRRRPSTQKFDVQQLCVSAMGFASTVSTRDLKRKLTRCVRKLAELQIVTPCALEPEYGRTGVGQYTLRLHRGDYFRNTMKTGTALRNSESPLADPLRAIGFEESTIRRLLRDYSTPVLREWADITLAAIERKIIRKTPMAYFVDNVKYAAAGSRTPPDWWHDVRRQERLVRRRPGSQRPERPFQSAHGASGSEPSGDSLCSEFTAYFSAAGQTEDIAKRNATRISRELQTRRSVSKT
jgi:hypothetical protein